MKSNPFTLIYSAGKTVLAYGRSLGIVALGLYFTARRIKGYCKNCDTDFK